MPIPDSTADRFSGVYRDSQRAGDVDWPAIRAAAVAPSDGADLAFVTRSLYVGVAGNVTLDMAESGSTITFTGVPAGTFMPLRVKRVRSTGTTASSIVALD